MEPEPTQHQPKGKSSHLFGRPELPLLKDVKREIGRMSLVEWESSVLRYVQPFAKKAKWRPQAYCRKVVGAMRLMKGQVETIRKVVDAWDALDTSEKVRTSSLDKACDLVEVDRGEFAVLALAAVKADFKRQAESIVELNLPEMVQASVSYASKDVKEASSERMRHLEKHGIIDKPRVPTTRIQMNQASIPARSFDSQMEDFDNAIEGEVLGETKLIGDGQ